MSERKDYAGTFTRIARLLHNRDLSNDEANQLAELIRTMIREILDDKVKLLAWMIGIGVTLIMGMLGIITIIVLGK